MTRLAQSALTAGRAGRKSRGFDSRSNINIVDETDGQGIPIPLLFLVS